MKNERQEVIEELRRRILLGYRPNYDFESACDHDVNWLVLERTEFDEIVADAKRSRSDQDVG